ncbi:CAAX amino terminal protease family protein [Tanacetum coccineum]
MADNHNSISLTELNRKSNNWAKIVDEIIRIEKKIFPKHESLARSFDDELKKKNSGLIYFEIHGDVGGYVMYSCPSSLCSVITKLAVKEQYRRQGHGEALVNAAIEKCRSKRINRVSLHVDPLRTSAMQLYKKLGFQIDTLAIQEKPITQDKVMKWSPGIVALCPLCRKDFSVLKTDVEYDGGNTWSTMAFYIFSLHIPLSFGGLSFVAKLLHQTVLDSETQVFSLILIQTLELVAFMLLLQFSKKHFNILDFFKTRFLPKDRNWLLASVLGLGSLLTVVFLTSLVADKLIGPKDVNNPVLKEILLGGPLSVTGSIFVYCLVTPFLEETVYRGFLLTSLASRMEWQKAVVVSSVVFSATHLSVDNFLQLCVIGVVLGCAYCWSGSLISPFVIHSLYNALILVITFTS